jgi:hypothetical protein
MKSTTHHSTCAAPIVNTSAIANAPSAAPSNMPNSRQPILRDDYGAQVGRLIPCDDTNQTQSHWKGDRNDENAAAGLARSVNVRTQGIESHAGGLPGGRGNEGATSEELHRPSKREPTGANIDPVAFDETIRIGGGWVADSARIGSSNRRFPSGDAEPRPPAIRSRAHADDSKKRFNKTVDTSPGPRTRQRATELDHFDYRDGRAIVSEQKPATKRGTMAARNWSMPGQKEDVTALKGRRRHGNSTAHSHSFTEGSGEQRIRHRTVRNRDVEVPRLGHVDPVRGGAAGNRRYVGPRDASDARRSRKQSAVRGTSSRPGDQKVHHPRQSHHRQHPQSRRKTPVPEVNPTGFVGTLRRILHL